MRHNFIYGMTQANFWCNWRGEHCKRYKMILPVKTNVLIYKGRAGSITFRSYPIIIDVYLFRYQFPIYSSEFLFIPNAGFCLEGLFDVLYSILHYNVKKMSY